MSHLRAFLEKRWWRLSIRIWLTSALTLLVVALVASLLFIRRPVVAYRPEHTIGVRDPAFFASAHALVDPVPMLGNRIELLHNGKEIFPAMLGAIKSARHSVNFEAYLFHSGSVGSQFRDALCERAQAGVTVRVLLDGVGSGLGLKNSDVEIMKRAGCQFAYYHATRSWRLDRINRRSHRRIMVVDGRVGFTGGVGFADEWIGDADAPGHWREDHARIEGPVVAKLQSAFLEHWLWQGGEMFCGPEDFPPQKPAGTLKAQVVLSDSFTIAPLPMVQAVAIAAAEQRIFITNAYCAPSDDQVDLLLAAAKRGVDVRLLIPGKYNDQPMASAAGRPATGRLLAGGVKIYEYRPTMIHSKTMVVDAMFSILGTSNLDSRSAAINQELDVTIYDEKFGREMEAVFEADLKNARPYTQEDFRNRPWRQRLLELIARPFHSQL